MHAERRAKLMPTLEKHGIDALLVTNTANARYLTGFTGSYVQLVLTSAGPFALTSGIYTNQISQEAPDLPVRQVSLTDPMETLKEALNEHGIKRLGFENGSVLAKTLQTWRDKLEGIELVPVDDAVESLRLIKDANEIASLRKACALADACFEHIQRLLRPEAVEWDIAMEIDFFFRRNGAFNAFDTIAVSGENSAKPHGKPGERRFQLGDFVTMDFGARVDGYCSDITRTVVIGKASDRHKEIYFTVLKALESAIDGIKPGRLGKEIDGIARGAIEEAGFGDYFGHGLGHSIGLTVHDGPGFSRREENVLQAGMVVTVEPGIYLPGFGGVRIEEDVLITETGCEQLTRSERGLLELDWTGKL